MPSAKPASARQVADPRAFFSKSTPIVREIYDAVLAAATKLGPTREEWKKTSIHLCRRTAFAGVALRKEALILTVKSPTDATHPRIVRREQASAHRWHLELRLERPSDLDRDAKHLLATAFSMSGP
jgi:hypothetical protein